MVDVLKADGLALAVNTGSRKMAQRIRAVVVLVLDQMLEVRSGLRRVVTRVGEVRRKKPPPADILNGEPNRRIRPWRSGKSEQVLGTYRGSEVEGDSPAS